MNLGFGAAFISAKIGVGEFPPFLFTSMRFLIIAIILLPFLRIHEGQMSNIFVISILGGGIHFSFFYLALDNSQYISSVAIVLQLGVPFATILSVIFLKEVIRWRRIIGILLAFTGVIVLIFEPRIFSDLGGIYFALLAALSMSISLLFMKKLDHIKVFDLQAWIAFISFMFLAIASYIFEQNHLDIIINASIKAWIAVIFTALVATGIGHAGFYYLITKYELSKITPLTLLAPVIAIINALIISYFSIIDGFNEIVNLKIILGGSFTLLGVGIVMMREKNKRVVNSP
jgi:O-acetylserine/cysteine efflux transporter